ncbi:MAG: hypothetical protein ACXABO_04430 [Promethearchaeota archaeon]|jgi:hypothetical protein
MKKSTKLMVVVLSAFLVGVVGYGIAYPTRITTYSGGSHTGCHGTNNAGSGTLSVTPVVSGRLITLSVTITGFTEAVTGDSAGTVSIGIPYGYGDNAEFGHGIEMNNVHGHNDYWATSLWEENLTAGGNTMHAYTFEVMAPETAGTYDLKVVALTGMNASGEALPIYRLEQTLTVTVAGNTATVASVATALPFGNIFGLILIGLVALSPIVLILIRKRK